MTERASEGENDVTLLRIRPGYGRLDRMEAEALTDELPIVSPSLKGLRIVYLFGSRVANNLGPMSDFDLGVLVDSAADGPRLRARVAHRLACVLQTDAKIDPCRDAALRGRTTSG